jgi:hypothetical protein
LFIDFARAFPSIPHDLLWGKLFRLGLSGKLIRILRSPYAHLSTQIRLPDALSSPIEITEGLAQGEVLSPLLFSLYISDIEELLQQFGVEGIFIDSTYPYPLSSSTRMIWWCSVIPGRDSK